ncbi:hypothetical protein [Cytophaga aurantiaca]|uniref:hypothetical protein n=1 Tax=Cytophaga aurantiaca TaxID=29530 RepID=UPI00035FDA0B|nr:hypothetical protein [Cytophaga aurantiaca]
MKKSVLTYRYLLLFALIFTMLGAVCYSPILKADSKSIAKSETKKSEKGHSSQHVLTIDHHVFSSLSFSFDSDNALFSDLFEYLQFGLPFEVSHSIVSASFQNSYLANIFPFAISAQAP